MTDGSWLWLLAGPNGAGKSTYAPVLSSDVEEIVRPDELAYGLSPTAPENATVRAGRHAISRIENLLKERRSFAVETTCRRAGSTAPATRVISEPPAVEPPIL
ncbi:MAG: hypothetical protein JOZ29_06170 [Deltaproteobacteria bacterium]|nr:hypothetical protein [Deltaproteobacteria bacterium]